MQQQHWHQSFLKTTLYVHRLNSTECHEM